MSRPIKPHAVVPLSSFWALPWRLRACSLHGRQTGLLILFAMTMLALAIPGFAPAGLVVGPCLMVAYAVCAWGLDEPTPLTAQDIDLIEMVLREHPDWETHARRWLSRGPLDRRHYEALMEAWQRALPRTNKNDARPLSAEEQRAALGNLCQGRLLAQADQQRMERTTAAAVGQPRRAARL